MKKIVLLLITLAIAIFSEVRLGINAMAGVRYDDLRMCVASLAGYKGGPIADGMLMVSSVEKSRRVVGIKIPIARPILFGAAFKVLQFEPEAFIKLDVGEKGGWQIMPGLGASFHYGPDYNSDLDNRGPDFFAAGPQASFSGIYMFDSIAKKERGIGLRGFGTLLWGEDNRFGTVAGITVDYLVWF